MASFRSEIVADATALAALAPAWGELWSRCPAATPFQSPAWLVPWWDAFHPGALRCAAVWAGARLVAFAPLYREDGPQGRRLLPLGVSVSDYLDVLVDPSADGAPAALARAIGEADWDVVSLEELAPGAAALALPCPGDAREGRAAQSACPVLPLAGRGLDEAVPLHKQRKLRLAHHRAERRAGFAVEPVAATETASFLDDLFRLHRARWASRGEPGVLDDPAVQAFHRAAAPALAEAGLARLFRMRLEGEVAGAYYGLGDARGGYAYLGGFDPAFGFESPGAVLMGHGIATAAAEGAAAFHFLRGREAYKYEWGAADRWSVRRTLTREAAHVA